uniref:RING-type E3 ubiquitin transferase n=1 Tax=Leersia perrieri TaxID=77586 RepID=A0A0D9W382_9ORYZ
MASSSNPSNMPCSSDDVANWICPDCSGDAIITYTRSDVVCPESRLVTAIHSIEADPALSTQEKAHHRQQLLGHASDKRDATKAIRQHAEDMESNNPLCMLNKNINCSFYTMWSQLMFEMFPEWKKSMCHMPGTYYTESGTRTKNQLSTRRMAKTATNSNSPRETTVHHYKQNEDRPDKAFTTERAKRAGMANASSGQIFVTIAPDHFGPILEKHDPRRNRGVRVGDHWGNRMECRQWGAHLPHIAGIAGQSTYGAQSVALSGGYLDDEDHGEWFLYTGSGGRDLSGNKRTNKEQSFDQKFEMLNAALRVSCLKGYPVRVVRSFKERRSPYAPETGVRYDGIYRIEKCWRKIGHQGKYIVCRYLFVRCDNEPAPWTSDEHGDCLRPLPDIEELASAIDITERKGSPAWDFDATDGWKWMITPPISKKPVVTAGTSAGKKRLGATRNTRNTSIRERLLKEFKCAMCKNVMEEPMTTPCAHNFCKKCLLGTYDNLSITEDRSRGGRILRARKIVKKCPSCPNDISDFLQNPQVNRDIMNVIESLQKEAEKEDQTRVSADGSCVVLANSDDENDGAWENQDDGNLC